jgi:glycine hydroxymethyltransferase
MLLKVTPTEDGATLKNMHIPHFPEMCLFHTELEYPTATTSGKVIVTYNPPEPSNPKRLEIPLEPSTKALSPLEIVMHQSATKGYNMGTEYNDWFSNCFGYPVVLAYLGPHSREVLGTLAPGSKNPSTRLLGKLEKWLIIPALLVAIAVNTLKDYSYRMEIFGSILITGALLGIYHYIRRSDRITFADCAPYLVISETSVDNVSARLEQEMDHTKFRPNIVISGAGEAFEEDFWYTLDIGPARLLLTGNCVRCQSLNVDYATGKMGTGVAGSVLKKLMKDRRVDSGAKFSPVFGRYSFLGKGDGSRVRVGDEVCVRERRDTRDALGKWASFLLSCWGGSKFANYNVVLRLAWIDELISSLLPRIRTHLYGAIHHKC